MQGEGQTGYVKCKKLENNYDFCDVRKRDQHFWVCAETKHKDPKEISCIQFIDLSPAAVNILMTFGCFACRAKSRAVFPSLPLLLRLARAFIEYLQ